MNNINKLNGNNINNSNKPEMPAFQKLSSFRTKIEKSDFCNSFPRYSTELKLINDAIKEAENKNKKDVIEDLKNQKASVLEALEKLGFKMKDNS
jgi:hypothetical protein